MWESAQTKTRLPHVAVAAARLIAEGKADRALLVCGPGWVAPSVPTRCPGSGPSRPRQLSVERSVLSNNAQVLCFGQRSSARTRRRLAREWLSYEFDPDSPRHKRSRRSTIRAAARSRPEAESHRNVDAL